MMDLELFSDRYEQSYPSFEDPAFVNGRARLKVSQDEVHWQVVLSPLKEADPDLGIQFEALKFAKHPSLAAVREWWKQPPYAVLVSEARVGRFFSETTQMLRDEVYLKWMAQALEVLATLHSKGVLHLAQHERSWMLISKAEFAEEERIYLCDPGLIPEIPFATRVHAGNLLAVAPELWGGEPLDGRADLYSLACLFLKQRSAHLFEKFETPKKLLELHRGGRMSQLVPKTDSPLNELLRRLLQPRPEDRPASALAALAGISEATPSIHGSEAQPLPNRAPRRQTTLIFSTLLHLAREGELELARTWLGEIEPRFRDSHPEYLDYLESYLARREGKAGIPAQDLETSACAAAILGDQKLKALYLLEEIRGEGVEVLKTLEEAWDSAKNFPDLDLQAKVLLKRGRVFLNSGRDTDALDGFFSASLKTTGSKGGLLRVRILEELADLWMQNGLADCALPLLLEASERTKGNLEESSKIHVALGLCNLLVQQYDPSATHFYEARSGFSALRQIDRLVWASLQECRLYLAQNEFNRLRRELRMLKARGLGVEPNQRFLDLIHISLWLETGEGLVSDFESTLPSLLLAFQEKAFRELAWAPHQTDALLARVLKRLMRDKEAEGCQRKSDSLKKAIASHIQRHRETWVPTAPGVPLSVPSLPQGVAVALAAERETVASPSVEQLQMEKELNLKLRDENLKLMEQVQILKSLIGRTQAPEVARPSRKPAAPERTEAASAAEAEPAEKKKLLAMLRRNLGNREQTAKELRINRRTLFAKLEKYGLLEVSFLPTRDEVLAALAECGGKKAETAKRLGMSRATFYRHLKELGL